MKKLSITSNGELLVLINGEPIIQVDENFKYHNNYLRDVLNVSEGDSLDIIISRLKQRVTPSGRVDFVMVYESGVIEAYSFIVGEWEFEGEYVKVISGKTFYTQQFKIMDLAHAFTPSIFQQMQLSSITSLYNAQSLELEKNKKKLEYLESLVTNRTTNPPMFGRMYCDEITEEEINPSETVKQIKKDIIRDREMFTRCPLSNTKTITEEELKSITPITNYHYVDGDTHEEKLIVPDTKR